MGRMKKLLAELKLFWLFGIRFNTGLVFHVVGGKFFNWLAMGHGETYLEAKGWVLLFAIGWEIVEIIFFLYKYGSWQNALIKTKYKTTKNWAYDSFGDILGAMIGTL
jgi:hypothetical protein